MYQLLEFGIVFINESFDIYAQHLSDIFVAN